MTHTGQDSTAETAFAVPPTCDSLAMAARHVLLTADARAKANASIAAGRAWSCGAMTSIGHFALADRPARPAAPPLVPPRGVAKRKINAGRKGRVALLHALAHIELNAIDLAWDLVARFGAEMGHGFCDDWVAVGSDEGRHFLLLDDHLQHFDCAYGDFPAHDGLWQAATDTADDLLARLAIVPMVLEARGLDVTPATVDRLRAVGDDASADILMTIYTDEISHVAAGSRWFKHCCTAKGMEPTATWRALVAQHFNGTLKPPFNDDARAKAGFSKAMYAPS